MIRPCGPGVERIHEEILNLFPNAKTHIITKEETIEREAFVDAEISETQT